MANIDPDSKLEKLLDKLFDVEVISGAKYHTVEMCCKYSYGNYTLPADICCNVSHAKIGS